MNRAMKRREVLAAGLAAGTGLGVASLADSGVSSAAQANPSNPKARGNAIAVSTYSYWRYRPDTKLTIEECIELAGEAGFDAVEVLHVQMEDQSNKTLQRIKQKAFRLGLDLCGLSTHQTFVSPDPEVRKKNIQHTIECIELAYAMGIPTIRVNTGRWGTSKNFDELMANRGIEPRLEGYTDDEGFEWVIDSLEKCLPAAESCGVVLGLENHWGLGRTAAGVLRVINAIDSPWLRAT
ncbi:MAG: sugar phosphate isomerase/epimerase family protein, partial [Planctomycetota bacterium]|nr:sugar phosphate isomerase/epimerase family protein [Planctomycetota bacterium]